MRSKLTILNVFAGLLLLWVALSTVIHYKALSSGEGWGIISMIMFACIAGAALVADAFLRFAIKNKKVLNVIGAVIVLGIMICLSGAL